MEDKFQETYDILRMIDILISLEDWEGLDEFISERRSDLSDLQNLTTMLASTWKVQDKLKKRDRLITYAYLLAIEKYERSGADRLLAYKITWN